MQPSTGEFSVSGSRLYIKYKVGKYTFQELEIESPRHAPESYGMI